ncbi:MAG: DUF935 family protein [Cyclobacteriaceae bacterium]
MALKSKKLDIPNPEQITVVNHPVTVGQLTRGNQSITRWQNALRAAESVRNPRRKGLYDLYLDIKSDGHLCALMDKRIRAVQTAPFEWHDKDGNPLENEKIIENLQEPWFFDTMRYIMEARFEGFTVVWFTLENGLFDSSNIIPRQNVMPEYNVWTKEVYGDPRGGVNFTQEPESNFVLQVGKPKDLGMLSRLAGYVLMKRDNMSFYAIFNEMFAMPMRVYWYDPNRPESRRQVEDQAKTQGALAYLVLPKGAEFDMPQGADKSGSKAAYAELHKMLNDEITISILGQTLTTSTEGVGSNALGRVHKQVEEGVNIEDMMYTEIHLNHRWKKIALKHGYPLQGFSGSFQRVEQISLEKKAQIWKQLHDAGVPIAHEDWWNEFGVPHPDDETIAEFKSRKRSEPAEEPKPAPSEPVPSEPVEEQPSTSSGSEAKWYQGIINKLTDLAITMRLKKKPLTYLEQISNWYHPRGWESFPGEGGRRPEGVKTASLHSDLQASFARVLAGIQDGTLRRGQVDEQLYKLIGDHLFDRVQDGFRLKLADLDPASDQYKMLAAIRENVYRFSAFKNYQYIRQLTDLKALVTPEAFLAEAIKVDNLFHNAWLNTESLMLEGNADMAQRWLEIEDTKDVLPYLKFRAVSDDRSRHLKYDGIIAPVNDPIWDWLTPLLEYGCRCTLEQLVSGTPTSPEKLPSRNEVPEQFRFNPGRKKQVVDENSHPYFKVVAGDKDAADKLFGVEVPG